MVFREILKNAYWIKCKIFCTCYLGFGKLTFIKRQRAHLGPKPVLVSTEAIKKGIKKNILYD